VEARCARGNKAGGACVEERVQARLRGRGLKRICREAWRGLGEG
jgi:hypothetical protein